MEKEDAFMPKMIIMYNLNDDLKEEDFVKWVHEYKGPFISDLPSVKSYILSKTEIALESTGGPLEPAEIPYNIVGIVDVTSIEAYAKDQETPAYKDDFTPQMMKWVKNMTYLKIKEFFPKP